MSVELKEAANTIALQEIETALNPTGNGKISTKVSYPDSTDHFYDAVRNFAEAVVDSTLDPADREGPPAVALAKRTLNKADREGVIMDTLTLDVAEDAIRKMVRTQGRGAKVEVGA